MAVTINGDGLVDVGGTSSSQGRVRLAEDTDNGSNYIELTAPASVASNRTVTMPDATTTLIGTDTTDTLTNKSIAATQLTGTIAAARLPAGCVLQVLQATTDTQQSTTSTSYVDVSGLSVTITPSSASNKVLVRYRINASSNNAGCLALFQIVRGSTAIGNGTVGSSRRQCHSALRAQFSDANPHESTSGEFLDSPGTTSATTYKIQYSQDTSTTVFVNRDQTNNDNANYPTPLSQIIVMEIAA